MVVLAVESLLFLVDSEAAEDWQVFLSKFSMWAKTRERPSAAVIDLECSSYYRWNDGTTDRFSLFLIRVFFLMVDSNKFEFLLIKQMIVC